MKEIRIKDCESRSWKSRTGVQRQGIKYQVRIKGQDERNQVQRYLDLAVQEIRDMPSSIKMHIRGLRSLSEKETSLLYHVSSINISGKEYKT